MMYYTHYTHVLYMTEVWRVEEWSENYTKPKYRQTGNRRFLVRMIRVTKNFLCLILHLIVRALTIEKIETRKFSKI